MQRFLQLVSQSWRVDYSWMGLGKSGRKLIYARNIGA